MQLTGRFILADGSAGLGRIPPVSSPQSISIGTLLASPLITAQWIGSAAICRQQRGVHIDATEARQLEDAPRKNLA